MREPSNTNEPWWCDRYLYEEILDEMNRWQLVAAFVIDLLTPGLDDKCTDDLPDEWWVFDDKTAARAVAAASARSGVINWERAISVLRGLSERDWTMEDECGDAVVRDFADLYGVAQQLLWTPGVGLPPAWAGEVT